MNLQLTSRTTKETFSEKGIEDYDLSYTLETEGKDVKTLVCTGYKPKKEGDTVSAVPSCSFTYVKGNQYPSGNATNGILPEAIQQHIKEVFDEIVALIAQGKPIIE